MSVGVISGNTAAAGVATVSITPASVLAATTAEQTFTVPGVQTGDFVFVTSPSITAGTGIVNARVSAAGSVAIAFVNATAGALTPAAGSYKFLWVRPDAVYAGVSA